MRRSLGSVVRGGVLDAGRLALLLAGFSLALAASAAAALPANTSGGLTFEERVACRERVEDVYWAHRIWPKENPGPKPPREAVLSRMAIAAQIDQSLRYEAALERHWRDRIAPSAIQAEMNRQAQSTRDPRMLRDLWRALDNDPFLIGECLVRPELAQRRIHQRYSDDPALHVAGDSDFDAWWGRERMTPERAAPVVGAYVLPQSTAVATCEDTWSQPQGLAPAPGARGDFVSVWTGAEMIVWGGNIGATGLNTGGRYTPATDTWEPTSMGPGVPAGRFGPAGVWTGTEMIVWGGGSPALNTGGRYSPATDTWVATSTGGNVPQGRSAHGMVWTGTEVIVWGGANAGVRLNTGGRYSPGTNSWLPTSVGANVPTGRVSHALVWAGSVMVVFGGIDATFGINTGGRYSPSTDTWLPTDNGGGVPAPRYDPSAVWTGSEVIVWGGQDSGAVFINTGGRYTPSTDSWAATSTGANVPSPRSIATAVWTGTQMIVWGGFGGTFVATGGRYTPGTDSWQATGTGSGVPSARYHHEAVWTGSEMIIWGGKTDHASVPANYTNTGSRYDPGTDTWLATHAGLNVPSPRDEHTAVWTGTEMIVWGGFGGNDTGGLYRPATDSWLPASAGANAPSIWVGHAAVWTGTDMIVWGGLSLSTAVGVNTGGRYSPGSDTWLPTGTGANVPAGRARHSAVWTGSEMVVWGGTPHDGSSPHLNSGGRYTPGTDSWLATSTSGALPSARELHTAVWTGNEMVVFGGTQVSGLSTGARYVASTDTWFPMSTGVNAPSARFAHSAVWTGEEMIVWGGVGSMSYLGTGSRYDPVGDDWAPVSTGANVPSARGLHTAVWTGNRMIIWGGAGQATGGRYAPGSDTWEPTSTTGVPKGRARHTAIWTGDQMLIWGGDLGVSSVGTNTGGLYCSVPPIGFFTLTPCRVFDSRTPGDGPAIPSGSTEIVQVAGSCAVPLGAKSVSLNLTIVGASGGGFLQAYAGNQAVPGTTVVSFTAGSTRANNALVQLAFDGSGTLALRPTVDNGTPLHVVVDVNGYFE